MAPVVRSLLVAVVAAVLLAAPASAAGGGVIVKFAPGVGIVDTGMTQSHEDLVDAAVIRTRNPTFTVAQARSKLDAAIDDNGPAGRDTQFGFGRVSLAKAAS